MPSTDGAVRHQREWIRRLQNNRSRSLWLRCLVAGVIVVPLLNIDVSANGVDTAQAAAAAVSPISSEHGSAVPSDQRNRVLGPDWNTSDDRIVVGQGDDTGFHVLYAAERAGYRWATLASLSEPGFDTDKWVGNACLTGDGRKVAVVYGPRSFTNDGVLMQRGGFSAVVDVETKVVTKLPFTSTMAYFNPGCGSSSKVTFTGFSGGDSGPSLGRTQINVVDATDAQVETSTRIDGQVTSAVSNGEEVIAAAGAELVKVSQSGKVKRLAQVKATPHHIVATGKRGVSFLVSGEDNSSVLRIPNAGEPSPPVELATGKNTEITLASDGENGALLIGAAKLKRDLPSSIEQITSKQPQTVSLRGHAFVTQAPTPAPYTAAGGKKPSPEWEAAMTLPRVDPGMPTPIDLTLAIPATGKTADFVVEPAPPSESFTSENTVRPGTKSPPSRARVASLAAGTSSSTIDDDALCSIPRNDPNTQVYQPTPRQVEWATNQAVTSNLNVTRSANWKQAGMGSSWSPQGLFPSTALAGGGRVPTQVMLGILAQESNLWQSAGHNLSGVPGNPLIGNYYGREIYNDDPSDDFDIQWSKSDCGYGVAQVTDGMRKTGSLTATQKRAVAVDYATNISAGLQILQTKWNQTRGGGLIHDNGNPAYLENWVFAIWAYNSGFYPQDGSSPWGVGWLNNPANPIYDVGRTLFGVSSADANNPQKWPYQEKVIGFAAYSIATPDGPGFRPSWWVSAEDRAAAQPPNNTFCTAANDCDYESSYTPNAPEVDNSPAGPCKHKNAAGQYDLKCWWHGPISYNDCTGGYCGRELLRFNSTYPEQPDGINYPPVCSNTGLPSGALVVDDVATSAAPINTSTRPCGSGGTNSGSLSFEFPETSAGKSPAKVDFHQSGAGYRGHVWWTHTRSEPRAGVDLEVTGTWKFDAPLTQWGRVLVHMPDYAAQTQQAKYVIDDGAGNKKTRFALQRTRKNRWVSLGVMKFNGKPEISLSSHTVDGNGNDDIVWDAVAIQPLSSKPDNFVVALGDSYTSGEGASASVTVNGVTDHGSDYYKETDFGGHLADDAGRNACHRSKEAWPRKTRLSDSTSSIGGRADAWDTNLDFQFHACSGAETQNVNDSDASDNAFGKSPNGQYGEMSQLDKGYLDSNTTLVMLSIGGNDAGFKDVIVGCFVLVDCGTSGTTLPDRINGPVRDSVEQTVRRIHTKAPNAKIMLMGYPVLLSDTCANTSGISLFEVDLLEGIIEDVVPVAMQSVIDSVALDGIQAIYADPLSDFQGMGICGSPEHIRGVVQETTEGDKPKTLGIYPPSNQSFHPNVGGTSDYAAAARRAILALGL